MKQKIEQAQTEISRRILRLNMDVEVLEKFEILCIQKRLNKFRAAEEALREWVEKNRISITGGLGK